MSKKLKRKKTTLTSKKSVSKKSNVYLTKREIRVIKLLCQQYSAGEMAKKLGLSRKTIENRIGDILSKIKSKNRIGIVIYAIKNKIYEVL